MTEELPAYRYRAVAVDADGEEVVQVFESNVEYMAGDELPLRSARWHVESVEQEGISHVGGDDQRVRVLFCALV
jgi:hypothetical protein